MSRSRAPRPILAAGLACAGVVSAALLASSAVPAAAAGHTASVAWSQHRLLRNADFEDVALPSGPRWLPAGPP